jgi:PBSX family phage terminase large subunit
VSLPFEPQIHPKLKFLLTEKWRYKGLVGGRDSGKSYSAADAVLARMINAKINVAACRELKTTIADSIHKLLIERISFHNIGHLFHPITDYGLSCKNGSTLIYKHLHNNVDEIKGLQNIMLCWIFEAQSLTKESFDILYPTIVRNEGAEIWVEWNPDNDDDFVMQRFYYGKDEDTKTVETNYLENALCSDGAKQEAAKCKRDYPEDYEHIWMGRPSKVGSRIYPMFDEKTHVRSYFDFDKMQNDTMFFMGQDPATVYYPFGVWMARVAKGEKEFDYIVYNEYPTVNMMHGKYFHEIRDELVCNVTLKQRAAMFRVLDNTVSKTYKWLTIAARGIDTRFAKASGAASTTLGGTRGMIIEMADIGNGGLSFETPQESIIDVQRDVLRGLLDYNKDLGLILGLNEPHFYVMGHCHNVIDALTHHRMDNKKKTEDPKRKDPIDAIRICLATMEGYSHVRKEKVQTEIREPVNVGQKLVETWMNNV